MRLNRWTIDLRDAAWFGRERAVGYAKMLAIAFVPTLAWFYFQATGPVGSDFMGLWSAGKFTLAAHPSSAYLPVAEQAFQEGFGRDHWAPFLCTPPFLFLIAPFAALPYALALPAWVAATYGVWLLVARRLAPGGFWPIAVFPGAVVCAWHAQNGFVTGALFVGAVLALRKQPILAGVLFGGLIIKPHLALLAPVALIAGRQWRAFLAAAASACSLLLLSQLAFGQETLGAFLSSASFSASLLESPGAASLIQADDFYLRMPTVFALVKVLAGHGAALVVQAVSTLLMAIVVWRTWCRPGDILGKGAVLAIATVLATPYLFAYDLPLLILPACWLAAEGLRSGFRPWERVALAVFYWTPLLGRSVALPLHFNPTVPLLAMFLVFVLRRLGSPVAVDPQESAALTSA